VKRSGAGCRAIAIDGPGGAGKSTAAKKLASELGFVYADTGAMYRAVGLSCVRNGVDLSDEQAVASHIVTVEIALEFVDGEQRVRLGGIDVTADLRTQEAGDAASKVAVYPAVREKLVDMQRKIAEHNDVVMDGRDIGTHVLPHATLKVYLVADPAERARRRQSELAARGVARDFETVLREVTERDERDSQRDHAPMRPAEDAVVLDASRMDAGEVCETIRKWFEERTGA